MRDGDWKLIEWFEDGSLELFNLHDDPGEHENVAAENTQKAKELLAKLVAWRAETHAVMPTPNPDFDGKPASSAQRKANP